MTKYSIPNSIEIIRLRSGMFVGSTETPDHLVREIVDNAFDEIVNGYANNCHIFHNESEGSFWVSDNGRGIQIGTIKLPDIDEEKDSIEVLCTRLFSGSKFDLKDYKTLIGMHGVGLVAVNALSEWLVIKTKNKSILYTYIFEDSKLKSINHEDHNDVYSTIVGFKPDKKYFENIQFNTDELMERLLLTKSLFKKCDFYFNDNKIPEISFANYVKDKLELSDNTLYEIKYQKKENEKIHILFTFVKSFNMITIGNVNLRPCSGTYLSNLQTTIKNLIRNNIHKKFKGISDKELLNGLRLYASVTVPEPKFDSQTKSRMVLNIKKLLIEPLENEIQKVILKNEISEIIKANLEASFGKVSKSGVKKSKRISVDNKLRDCRQIPGDVLYIVEGDSADGSLKIARDKESEASFPLKGKVLNVETSSLSRIESNDEIKYLREAIGPVEKRRYKKIKILTDADSDGLHIAVLVLLVLQKFTPDLIKEGRVSVILPPLYGAEKGKEYYPIYDHKDIKKYKDNGFEITRFKGLGEMDADKLAICIRSGMEYVIQWSNEKIMKSLLLMMSNSELGSEIKKRIMNSKECRFEKVLNDVLIQKKEK